MLGSGFTSNSFIIYIMKIQQFNTWTFSMWLDTKYKKYIQEVTFRVDLKCVMNSAESVKIRGILPFQIAPLCVSTVPYGHASLPECIPYYSWDWLWTKSVKNSLVCTSQRTTPGPSEAQQCLHFADQGEQTSHTHPHYFLCKTTIENIQSNRITDMGITLVLL